MATKKKKKSVAEQIIDGTYQGALSLSDEPVSEQIIKGTYKAGYDDTFVNTNDDPSPLANVINSTSNKEKEEPKWWQEILQVPDAFNDNLDRFKDGYQFGDITKTVGETVGDTVGTVAGSVADLGLGVIKGVAQTGENLASLAAGGIAQVADWTGNDKFADNLRKEIATSKPPASTWLGQGQDLVDNFSIFGDTGDKTSESVGYMASLWASGGLGKIGQTATMFGSAAGSTLPQSYSKEGVTDAQVWTKALGTGAIETVTERLFGLFGTSGIDKTIANKVSKKITSGAGKILARSGVAATGEAFEEFLSYTGSQGLDSAIDAISNGKGAEFKEDWNWEEVGEQMAIAFLATGALSAGGVGTSVVGNKTNTNTWSDAVNETAKQQDIQALQEDITNLNEKLNKEGKNTVAGKKLQLQINERQAELNKLTATDNTAQVQGLQEAIVKKQEELNNAQDPREQQIIQEELNILNEELTEVTNAQQFTNTEQNVDNNELKRQNFVYEENENDSDIKKNLYKSASNYVNNTKESHAFVDLVAKIAEERNTAYEFVDSETLKQLGHSAGKNIINGLVTDEGKVLINIESKKALETVVGHETTHLLEGTKEYQALQDYVIEYAKQKGIYEEAYRRLEGLYEGKNADINAELTADLVGDLLFSDTNFVRELSVQHRNVFEKFYDYIKHLYKMATAGSKEARQLEQLKYKFEEAYKAEGTKTKGETQLSVSNSTTDNQGRELTKEQQEFFKDSKVRDENGNLLTVYHGTASDFTIFQEEFAKEGDYGIGFYFTDNKNVAKEAAEISAVDKDISKYMDGTNTGKVMESYLDIKKPSVWYNYKDINKYKALAEQERLSFYDYMRKHYDGIIVTNPRYSNEGNSDAKYYIVFNSNQIKNVDNTKPTTDPDIRYSLSEDTDIDTKINSSMTMEQAKRMIEMAFKDNRIKDWYDGQYQNGDEWLKGEGIDEVETYLDNTTSVIERFLNPLYAEDETYGDEYYTSDILQAYLDGTLTGKQKQSRQNIDLTRDTGYKDSRFYAPQNVELTQELYNKASERVTNKNREEIYKARADFIIAAHNPGAIKNLGLDIKEVNKKLRDWSSYTKEARELSQKFNEGVARQNQWSGLENSSLINKISVSNEQMESLVKEVKGDSSKWQRDYITSTMLAIDTHIDYSNLTFEFDKSTELHQRGANGEYDHNTDVIKVGDANQNTVAHEMGHYIDFLWARQLANNYHSPLSDIVFRNLQDYDLTDNERIFMGNFKNFIQGLSDSATLGSDYSQRDSAYWQRGTEVFARFTAEFTEWVKNKATNNRYSYERERYGNPFGDNFTESQYREFVKILQEKAMLDTSKGQFSLSYNDEAPVKNPNLTYGEDIKYQVEEAIAPLQETIENLTEQVKAMQENIVPTAEQYTQPTTEEIKNLMDIKEKQSGSEYASAFFALRDKYGQENLYKSLNEYYSTGTVTQPNNDIDIAPTSQEVVEQQQQDSMDSLMNEPTPPMSGLTEQEQVELDMFEDFINKNGFEALDKDSQERFRYLIDLKYPDISPETTETKVESPFDSRDIDEVGNRKVKAYQYENPEVRPYFRDEAENMMWDLNNTIKGERSFNDQLYYDSGGEQGFFGTTRQTTEAIAYLKDNYGYSYAQIEKGLNDIIEDNGKENNAVAKRIEFMLDERLREGYTTSDGIPIPPNQEYIKFLEEKQITEYNRANLESLAIDENVPVEENTVVEQPETAVEPELKLSEQVAPQPVKVAQNGNTEVTDTSKETKEQEKVAQILSEAPTKQNEKSRLWARFKANFIDKGSVFESLSLKTKNRNLIAKWDNILLSESQAQDVMLNGTREIDAMRKTNKQVSKSLFDIKAEVGDKVQQFSEYVYHKHNIDRMSLEAKAEAKAQEIKEKYAVNLNNEAMQESIEQELMKWARKRKLDNYTESEIAMINELKELLWLEKAKNKPVFGESVTAEVSQKIVDEFEMNNPEFIDWANDVYDYNNANLNHLVANGVVSQKTADYFAEIYPHYVPIGRAKNLKNAINVPLDTNKTGINTPIARATGGNSDILPLFDTLANRTIQTYRAAAKNDFGVELKNTLNSTIDTQTTNVEEILDNVDQQENLLQEGKNGLAPTFTVFENGEKVTYEISQDMFDALKPVSEGLKGNILWGVPNKISNFHRGVLTEYNPVFMLTNGIKDFQDILLNSQHASKTYSKIPEAYAQIIGKGYWYQEYMANGGQQNSYFDSQEGNFDTEHKGIYKVLDLPPLKQISQLNNFIELAPRLAEYIASREVGRSKKVAMLDAARVTTNFKAGGDITKWANRNGATFLNASVQGAMQQVRNVKEAHANGVKGYANLVAKFTLASVPALILNALLWGDDDEYEELSDYVKQSYWIVGKYGDGNFIRIPKGRMVTVVQEALNQMTNLVTGNDEADLGQFLEIVGNNIAPTNPIESNILSPILQATSNKTWYGGDLVPTRLQDLPAEEQYDESIDKLSIALGQKLGISPYKINYVLDQYSGGIGDVLLPMLTEEAEGGKDDLMSNILAPLTNKFTVDSTMKNQSVSDFYDLSDELTKKANSSKATEEDVLRNKYVNSIKSEMSELYQQKREIQSSNLSDSEKYEQVRELQDQINNIANAAMTNYDDMTKESNYAEIGGVEYYKNNKNEWVKVNDEKEGADLNAMNMSVSDKNTYFKTKNEINKLIGLVEDSKDGITIEDEDSEEYKDAIKYLNSEKKEDIINKIINTGFTDEQKAYMYKKFYNTDTIDLIVNANISVDDYLTYTTKEFTADYNEKGNAISGSKKEKVFDYINSLEMNIPQKVILFKMEYPKDKDYTGTDYNYDILDYVKDLDASYKDKVKILRKVGIEVDDNGDVYW